MLTTLSLVFLVGFMWGASMIWFATGNRRPATITVVFSLPAAIAVVSRLMALL